jgi:hypothetical protein
MSVADANGDGKISLNEFLSAGENIIAIVSVIASAAGQNE